MSPFVWTMAIEIKDNIRNYFRFIHTVSYSTGMPQRPALEAFDKQSLPGSAGVEMGRSTLPSFFRYPVQDKAAMGFLGGRLQLNGALKRKHMKFFFPVSLPSLVSGILD